jgi:hypothetical protein
MSRPRSRRQRLLLATVGVTVLLLFFIRRAGLLPNGNERFDPGDYVDVVWVTTDEVSDLVGERGVVCGRVVNVTFARETGGQPTYLNLDRAFPDQPFDAVIWGRDLDAFPVDPRTAYAQREVCVAGRVTEHRGVPRIELRSPAQIEIQ